MYKVKMTSTLEDQAVHVEESDSCTLAYGVEDDDPQVVVQLTWEFLCTHPGQCSFHLQLAPGLPAKIRAKIVHAAVWLLRKMVGQEMARQIIQGHRRRRRTKAGTF